MKLCTEQKDTSILKIDKTSEASSKDGVPRISAMGTSYKSYLDCGAYANVIRAASEVSFKKKTMPGLASLGSH